METSRSEHVSGRADETSHNFSKIRFGDPKIVFLLWGRIELSMV